MKPIRRQESLGGHAYALVGFNRIGFVIQNSWGEKWGNCGFGVLPYEEWVKYGADAWTSALGVPAAEMKTSAVPVRSKEKVVIARAGALSFVSAAKSAAAESRKEISRWSAEEAYRHTLVMGNDGQVINRILTHENARSLHPRHRLRRAS